MNHILQRKMTMVTRTVIFSHRIKKKKSESMRCGCSVYMGRRERASSNYNCKPTIDTQTLPVQIELHYRIGYSAPPTIRLFIRAAHSACLFDILDSPPSREFMRLQGSNKINVLFPSKLDRCNTTERSPLIGKMAIKIAPMLTLLSRVFIIE